MRLKAMACILGLAVATASSAQTTAEAASSQANSVRKTILDFIARWDGESPKPCDSTVIKAAEELSGGLINAAASQAAALSDPRLGSTSKYLAMERLKSIAPVAAVTRLDLADAYYKSGCLEPADNIYRSVLTTFTGPLYDAYRTRAQVGIDDVRAAKAKGPSPPVQ